MNDPGVRHACCYHLYLTSDQRPDAMPASQEVLVALGNQAPLSISLARRACLQVEARHLDRAFRLLREDMFASVRDALTELVQPSKTGSHCVVFREARPVDLVLRPSPCILFTFEVPRHVAQLSSGEQVRSLSQSSSVSCENAWPW